MKKLLFLFLLLPSILMAQNQKEFLVSVFVKDSSSGTYVENAFLLLNSKNSSSSDINGFAKFKTNSGLNTISVYHVSYEFQITSFSVNSDTTLIIEINAKDVFLQDINITEKRYKVNNGKIEIAGELIRKGPSIMGTSDPLRYVQTLSGVNFISDMFSGIYVRGGGFDQTWVRIDGVPVYNSSHLYGFNSVLNASAIQSLTLYKSNLPSDFGTKGSALLDVRLQPGSLKKTTAELEIGLMNTAFNLSVPIIKNKLSYSTNFRTGYPFLIAGLIMEEAKDLNFYYYDWYHKFYYDLKKNKKLTFTVINYADNFGNTEIDLGLSPYGQQQRWRSLSAVTNYYGLNKNNNSFDIKAGYTSYSSKDFIQSRIYDPVKDKDVKKDIFSKTASIQSVFANSTWTNYLKSDWEIEYGANLEYIFNKPFQISVLEYDSFLLSYNAKKQSLINADGFLMAKKQINNKSKLRFGSRLDFIMSKDEKTKMFVLPEPRVYYEYKFNSANELNLAYERSVQLQSAISPFLVNWVSDFWFLSGIDMKPQIANQFSIGFLNKFGKNSLNTELYYKPINDVPDFKEGSQFLVDYDFFENIVLVKTRNYGIELDHEFIGNKFIWRNSLTLSKSMRFHPEINEGMWYKSDYDIPVKFNSNINFKLNKKWEFTANFIIQHGRPFTYYYYPGWRSEINEFRYPVYHRLDVAFFYHKPIKQNAKTQHSWNLSIFNVYNRLNPTWGYPENGRVKGIALFPIMPSFNYIIKIR